MQRNSVASFEVIMTRTDLSPVRRGADAVVVTHTQKKNHSNRVFGICSHELQVTFFYLHFTGKEAGTYIYIIMSISRASLGI